jgi:hypothetical protein
MENFNLKKFLVENKLTINSRMLSEEGIFGDVAFGGKDDAPVYAKAQGKEPGSEPNTKDEQKLLDALEEWLESFFGYGEGTILRFKKEMPLLKQQYPQIFQPQKPDGTLVYRGLSSINDYLQDIVDNSTTSDWKQAGEGWWIYKKPVKPRSNNNLQSYSYSIDKAKLFGENNGLLVTKQDENFFMNSDVYNPLEQEILHYGRIYKHPVYFMIADYTYEMDVYDEDEE